MLVCSRILSLSFVQRPFHWDGGNGLSGEKCVGTGEKLLPSKCVKEAMISRITLRYLSTLDLTQIFEKTFHEFAQSTTTFLFFLGLPSNLGLSKTKRKRIITFKASTIDLKIIKSYNFQTPSKINF